MEKPGIYAKRSEVMTLEPGTYYWCSCGKSTKQPFCNGAHKGSSFSPVQFEIEEEKQVALCLCKHTKKAPYCDGTHDMM